MTARNEITGKWMKTKPVTNAYANGWDAIFGKKEKLGFEEWKAQYIAVTPEARKNLQEKHNINADEEIDAVVKQLYQDYLDS